MRHTCFFKRSSDKPDIICGTAAAAGLCDNDSGAVKIIFSGKKSRHDLADDHQGRIAGIVIDVLKAGIDSLMPVIGQHLHVVAFHLKSGLQHIKMNRRHLRRENRVITHLLREQNLFESAGADPARTSFAFGFLLAHADRGQKRPHTDPGSTQIVDLIDLQTGVDLVRTGQNIGNFIGRNGIETASE